MNKTNKNQKPNKEIRISIPVFSWDPFTPYSNTTVTIQRSELSELFSNSSETLETLEAFKKEFGFEDSEEPNHIIQETK